MIIFLVVLLILIALLFTNVTFDIEGNNLKFSILIKFFGIVLFNSNKNKKNNKTNSNNEEKTRNDKFKTTLSKTKDILSFIKKHLLSKLIITRYNISYRFGFSDAARTGIYSGVVYAAVYGLDSYISNNYKIKKKNISIVPDFDNEVNEFSLNLVLKIKLFNLIILLSKGLNTLLKK